MTTVTCFAEYIGFKIYIYLKLVSFGQWLYTAKKSEVMNFCGILNTIMCQT